MQFFYFFEFIIITHNLLEKMFIISTYSLCIDLADFVVLQPTGIASNTLAKNTRKEPTGLL